MNLVLLLNVALSIVACAALAGSTLLALRLGRGDHDDEWPTHVPVAPQPWPSLGPRGDDAWHDVFDLGTIDVTTAAPSSCAVYPAARPPSMSVSSSRPLVS